MSIHIYYDGDCPFCSRYVRLLRLRDAAGPVVLTNLREDDAARQRFTDAGLAPDDGMLVETEGGLFHGADALNVISMLSSPSGFFNRLNAQLFRSQTAARFVYPLLRAGRNATLLMLGRSAMRSADPGEAALFELTSRFLGVFTVLHVFIYYLRYTPFTHELTTWPLLAVGLALVFSPGSKRLFIAAILLLALDGWLQAPAFSNHTILKNFLILSFVAAGLYHWIKGSAFERFFRDVRPVARSLLLVMYTFGIFHKINSDFLNPAVSCAVELWRTMPPPLVWIDNVWMHYLAIFGTLIVESVIMVLLVLPRFRHLGIGAGIAFHVLLALSGFAMYPAFSTLAITLHTMFLSPAAALQIKNSKAWTFINQHITRITGVTFVLSALFLMALSAVFQNFTSVGLFWLVLMIAPLIAVIFYDRPQHKGEEAGVFFWSRLHWLNIVSLLFFLNCAAPYLGLKTAQTMNMFSNLRLEGGISNHLLLSGSPGPFGYLQDLVTITDAEGSRYLEGTARAVDRGLVYYHFLTLLETTPEAVVTYRRNNLPEVTRSAQEILALDGDQLHPAWIRKYFHFRPVFLESPRSCD